MEKRSNRLMNEKSPYLLQHAHNPVDWYPWSEEAFDKAKKEDKPVFVSIGYSTCHWCHVMEKESFEDEEVAEVMNKTFVNIKVDREERPDLDSTYMMVSQMMTGTGGWPLNIIMTYDKKPIFALTYIPKESRYGRMGILEMAKSVGELWKEGRQDVEKRAAEVLSNVEKAIRKEAGEAVKEENVKLTYEQLSSNFDEVNGGFGSAPKFPSPHNLLFLLRYYEKYKDENALHMVEKTLKNMRLGGVYDHIGFGFHRYSTDAGWFLPHFEKMIYDQGLLIMAYSEAYQITKDAFYKDVVGEIFQFLKREMIGENGGFYSAIDADSENEEGKFYTWRSQDIVRALGQEYAETFMDVYNVDPQGNYMEEATGRSTGRSIIFLNKTLENEAKSRNKDVGTFLQSIEKMRVRLFEDREKRIHPQKDDKILTDMNGIMIAALSKASQAFDNEQFAESARNSADFVIENMITPEGGLMHRFRDGEAAIPGFLDDYSFMIWGLLELYETIFDEKYLEAALNLNDYLIDHFQDSGNGAFFFTSDESEKVLIRNKEGHDGAIPSGNSVQMMNLLRLSLITGEEGFREKAYKTANDFSSDIERGFMFHTHMMSGINFALGPSYEISIIGSIEDENTKDMISALREKYIPNKAVLLSGNAGRLGKIKTQISGEMKRIGGKTTAYVCTNFACKPPVTEASKLIETLEAS